MTVKRVNRVRLKATIGWKFLVDWKDGSQYWLTLKLLKESNPVELAQFGTAINISYEPAFSWWVPFFLRKRGRIMSAVNS